MEKKIKNERYYNLDWLRVFVAILLVPFHTGLIFTNWGQSPIRNDQTSIIFIIVAEFMNTWQLQIFFLLSGASTLFALNKLTPTTYIKERFIRLIVPLVFGVLVIVPPQTYCEQIQKLKFNGSYFDYYFYLLGRIYPARILSLNHLWFLYYLFIISLIVLILILILKSHKNASLMKNFSEWFTFGYRIFLLFIPIAIIQMSLKAAFPGPRNITTDWAHCKRQINRIFTESQT